MLRYNIQLIEVSDVVQYEDLGKADQVGATRRRDPEMPLPSRVFELIEGADIFKDCLGQTGFSQPRLEEADCAPFDRREERDIPGFRAANNVGINRHDLTM